MSDLLRIRLSPLSGPQILRCISEKFSPSDFIGHPNGGLINTEFGSHLVGNSKTENRTAYYIKLGMGRFGLMLPGLGYDCFRFDNSSSRLPIIPSKELGNVVSWYHWDYGARSWIRSNGASTYSLSLAYLCLVLEATCSPCR